MKSAISTEDLIKVIKEHGPEQNVSVILAEERVECCVQAVHLLVYRAQELENELEKMTVERNMAQALIDLDAHNVILDANERLETELSSAVDALEVSRELIATIQEKCIADSDRFKQMGLDVMVRRHQEKYK